MGATNMNKENFNLKWNSYTDHLREMLHDMMTSNELTDVTIVSEDKTEFRAHKVVLSACSTVFKSIVDNNLGSNPIVYLRGIKSHGIESILEFIYLGQTTFHKDRMNEFLDVAKCLDIKDMNKDIQGQDHDSLMNQKPEGNAEPTTKVEEEDMEKNKTKEGSQNSQDISKNQMPQSTIEAKDSVENNSTMQSLAKINLNATNDHACDQCEKQFKCQSNLSWHKTSTHRATQYPCGICSYKSTRLDKLQAHMKNVHDGIKVPCDQCDKMFSPQSLSRHKKSVHLK